MVYFKKILVVTPANAIQASVVAQSVRIAKEQQSHVTFFSVTEELPKEQLAWITLLPPQELMANVFQEQQASLSKSVVSFQDDFPSVDAFNAIGLPFIEVIKKVQQENYDLVILAAKANSHARKRFFGSTTCLLYTSDAADE